MSTTDTWEKLAKPEIRAKQIADEATWTEVTVGTEKQIKFANDLRSNFVKEISNQDNDLPVRWAVIKQERGERLETLDYGRLAEDAWNRRTLAVVNTADAKVIIDWFVSPAGQARRIDSLSMYKHIIRFPSKWAYDSRKGWVRTSYK